MTPPSTTAPAAPLLPPVAPPPVALSSAPATGELANSPAQRLVVVTAPANGRFQPVTSDGGVDAGDVVATLTGGRRPTIPIRMPVAATLRGSLCRAGQLVRAGDALLWGEVAIDGARH